MFKILLKISILVLVFICVGAANPDSKVSASQRCPNSHEDAQNNLSWGVTPYSGGQHAGEMAGLIIHAYDPTNNNQQLDVSYHLRSAVREKPYTKIINGEEVNMNARIFKDFQGNFSNRVDDHQGFTYSTLWDTTENNLDIFSCHGWDAYAPIEPYTGIGRVGNAYVLDCGPTNEPTQFWFSSISPPSNSPNGRKGHWSVDITASSGNVHIDNLDNNPMSFDKSFEVTNGANTFVNFVWHPDPPDPPKVSQSCEKAIIRDDGGHNGNRTYTNVNISGTNNDQSLDIGHGEEHTFGYQAISGTITITRIRYENKGSPTSPNWVQYEKTDQAFQCYHARCYITDVLDQSGRSIYSEGGFVQVNQPFKVRVKFWNDNSSPDKSTIPESVGSYRFSMTELKENGHDYIRNPVGFAINPGTTEEDARVVDIPQPPQPSPQVPTLYTVNFYPAMDNGDGNTDAGNELPRPIGDGAEGSTCRTSIPIYQYFSIEPRVSIKNTNPENPTTVTYTSGGRRTQGPTTISNITSSLTKKPFGGSETSVNNQNTNESYGDVEHDYTYNNPVINAGDEFRAHVKISPASGYIGPPGYPILQPKDEIRDSAPVKTVNQPYTHFFGNDVRAGGGFGSSCQKNQKGVIYAYNNTPDGRPERANKGGSGAQFGVHAMDIISGLGSANLRIDAPLGLSGLSFANDTAHMSEGTPPSKTTGGYLGSAGLSNFCLPDYFSDKPALLSTNPDVPLTEDNSSTSANVGADTPAKQWYKPSPGTALRLNSGTIPNGMNQAIFVDGDVEIVGDGIKYSTEPRTSVTAIPSFYLVVKNGNIRISKDVKQLDGVYVAQPVINADGTFNDKTSKTGIINTCYIGTSFDGDNTLYKQCKNQLVVNGAFVANKVILARAYSSLRYSMGGEYNMGGFPSGTRTNCGNSDKDIPRDAAYNGDCAAEIFNFSPELYMSQPAINARYGAPTGKFDAITSLSPVL